MAQVLNSIVQTIRREPAMTVALIDAVLALAMTAGAPLSPAEKAGIDAVLATIAGIVIRSQVVPTATLAPPALNG
jgi:hypothetical protein